MNAGSAEPERYAPPPPPREGWGFARWAVFLVLVVAAHFALIFLFGTKKHPLPRAVANAPQLTMASGRNELFALTDPTLFAKPHDALDFMPADWQRPPPVTSETFFRWTRPPSFLPPAAEDLGATFSAFLQSNRPAAQPLDLKPPPEISAITTVIESALPQASTFELRGELARRPLQEPLLVPTLACNDVLPPSRVQLLVDEAGVVLSAVVLPPDNPQDTPARSDGDIKALALVRSLRFAPAPQPTLGEIILTWHTVPTNAPASEVQP